MNLTCIPTGSEELDRNFVEVKTAHRGHSEGAPLSARDLNEKLLVLLHDTHRHKGCLSPCEEPSQVADTVSAMRHYMINHWGSRPQDVDVLLAGGMSDSAEFTRHLKTHLKRLELGGEFYDARFNVTRPIGKVPTGAPAQHIYYYPKNAQVELVQGDEPGGRAYQSQNEQVTSCKQATS